MLFLLVSLGETNAFSAPLDKAHCDLNRKDQIRSQRLIFWGATRESVKRLPCLSMTEKGDFDPEKEDEFCGDGDLDTPSFVLGDLDWRVEKLRLEEANTRRFLKARPVFLPYEECRKWVAAWSRWSSEEDWLSWIDMGEKRNSYIPTRPDEYYGRLGQWISWEHFLGIEEQDDENNDKLDLH